MVAPALSGFLLSLPVLCSAASHTECSHSGYCDGSRVPASISLETGAVKLQRRSISNTKVNVFSAYLLLGSTQLPQAGA